MSFKDFEHVKLTEHIKNINQEKLDIDIKDLLENDIILIKSGTATGKTKNIGKLSKELKENTKCKILSVVNLITLADEQIKTFKEESNTILKDYQTELKEFNNNDGVICINSIFKLHSIDYDFSSVILYIDEVNDLIKSLTHNDGMDKTLNKIYMTLTKIIKKCKKIMENINNW